MKKNYIKPEIAVEVIEAENLICESIGLSDSLAPADSHIDVDAKIRTTEEEESWGNLW